MAGQPAVNTDVIVPDYHTMLRENAKRARTFDSIQEAGEGATAWSSIAGKDTNE